MSKRLNKYYYIEKEFGDHEETINYDDKYNYNDELYATKDQASKAK